MLEDSRPAAGRHVALDALRGFAVLGIFMMNVQTFAMIQQAYLDPLAHMDFSGANRAVWFAGHVFFSLKFIAIFSILFGAGVAMTVGERAGALSRHGRRMTWLLLLGLIHAYALWYGDILVTYAVWGMVAALFVDRQPRLLIAAGVALAALTAFLFWQLYASWGGSSFGWRPSAGVIETAAEIARAPFGERILRGAEQSATVQMGSLTLYGPRVLGCMLIGIALYRTGFLTGAWPARRYALAAALSLPPGIGAAVFTARAMMEGGFLPPVLAWASVLDHMTSLATAFGYMALVMLAAKADVLRRVTMVFAAVGRMALTNYITQSVIAGFLFFGPPGLGWFGTVERTGQFAVVLGVWALLLIWSPLWLAAFRFGPLEWVWRSLTYGRLQPMRKRA